MAKAKLIVPNDPPPLMIELTLTEEEAMYVYSALQNTRPEPEDRFGPDSDDPVYEALTDVLPKTPFTCEYAKVI